ncbi:MAG: prolipoprotein diacylglyceryl transferase [bacterium]
MLTFIYRHDIDPYLIRFTENFGIRWYGVAYLLGFLIGFLILRFLGRRGYLQVDIEQIADLTLIVALWGIIGGRLGYVFLYGLTFLKENPFYIFQVWSGGMSFHGGLLGGFGGLLWCAYTRKIDFWELGDLAALAVPPGIMLGRIANFINGELWGRPTSGSWGVIFPGSELTRHPSQLYEAVLEGPVLLAIGWLIYRKYPRRGYAGAAFLFFYGLLRFLVEFTRAPDPHIGYIFLGLTRGQLYSLLLLPLAATIFYYRYRTTNGVS